MDEKEFIKLVEARGDGRNIEEIEVLTKEIDDDTLMSSFRANVDRIFEMARKKKDRRNPRYKILTNIQNLFHAELTRRGLDWKWNEVRES